MHAARISLFNLTEISIFSPLKWLSKVGRTLGDAKRGETGCRDGKLSN